MTRAAEPIVDVGIPTHGRPAYLAEAIDCVVAQTFRDWRLTISENGEGNEFVARIVEPYLADPRISHVVVGENVGGTGTRTGSSEPGRPATSGSCTTTTAGVRSSSSGA